MVPLALSTSFITPVLGFPSGKTDAKPFSSAMVFVASFVVSSVKSNFTNVNFSFVVSSS